MIQWVQSLLASGRLEASNFIGLSLVIIALFISVRIAWRLEKQFAGFFRLMILAFFFMFLNEMVNIFIDAKAVASGIWLSFLRGLPILFFILALTRLNNLITQLNKEK